MEVIVIESEAFKAIEGMVSNILSVVTAQSNEIKQLKDNRLMSVKEVCSYTGFGIDWVNKHKEHIGYTQIGCKDLRFYKEDVDSYFLKHRIQSKYR